MIPTQGQVGFTLTGNMTIHGVTKEVAFKGIATFRRKVPVAGRAKTDFTFATFGLTKPAIGRLMGVDDKDRTPRGRLPASKPKLTRSCAGGPTLPLSTNHQSSGAPSFAALGEGWECKLLESPKSCQPQNPPKPK